MRDAKLGNKSYNFGKPMNENNKKALQKAHKKAILQFNLNGCFIKEFDSIKNAISEVNISQSAISNCLLKKTKTSGGYIWYYKNDFKNNYEKLDKETIQLATTTNNNHKKKSIIQMSKEGIFIRFWDSITEASNILNINRQTIRDVCKKKKHKKTAGGFIWKYTD